MVLQLITRKKKSLIVLLLFISTIVSSLHIPQKAVTTASTISTIKSRKSISKKLRMLPAEEVAEWVAQPAADLTQFVPVEVSQEIWIGAIIATLPFVWATKTFGTRIIVQRECLVCKGSGLVYITKKGNTLTRARKCWSCGGFLPWLGWKMFFFSSFFDIGNGGKPLSLTQSIS